MALARNNQSTDSAFITRHVLSNGLTLLLRELHHAPVCSWWLLYKVGSRNEPTGLTGASHWVEHMLFRGTPTYPAGTLDRLIDRAGGTWNAQTSYDYTAYYETLPSDHIELAFHTEADRMINAQFDPAIVETERTVIISERQGNENNPSFWLDEEVLAAAFRVHGYHHTIIGDMADLQRMTRDDLYQHYRTYYVPSNAIGALVGDFETGPMIERLEAHFGRLPQVAPPPLFCRPEPEQYGERRLKIHRPSPVSYLTIAHKAPPFAHPDWLKLFLLDCILGGASGFSGGSIGNRTSRLYQALIRTEQALSFSCGLYKSRDPHLFSIDAALRQGQSLEAVETIVLAEIQRIAQGEVSQAELDRARKQVRALLAYSGGTVTNQAFWLAYFEHIADDYHTFTELEQRLASVQVTDLVDVAARYFQPDQRTVGWLIPTTPSKE